MGIRYRRELPDLMKRLGLPMVGVEVGVAQGSFSWELLYNGIEKLYSVDAWRYLPQTGDGGFPENWHNTNYEMAKQKLSEFGDRSIILRGLSEEMSNQVSDDSLGLVYLDGDHSPKGVRTDLRVWYPKLVKGGIIATHDYESPAYGTKEAFEEFAQQHGLEIYLLPEDKIDDAGAYMIKK